MRKSMLAVAAAISMLSMSSAAVAQSAAPLSLASQMPAGNLKDANAYRGGIIIPALIILAIGGLIYALTKNGDPSSP